MHLLRSKSRVESRTDAGDSVAGESVVTDASEASGGVRTRGVVAAGLHGVRGFAFVHVCIRK